MDFGDAVAYLVLIIMIIALVGVLGWLAMDQRKLSARVATAEQRVQVLDETSAARVSDVSAYFSKSIQGVQGSVTGLGASMSNAMASAASSNAAAMTSLRGDIAKQVTTDTLKAQEVRGDKLNVGGTWITAPSGAGNLFVQGTTSGSKATLAGMSLQVDGKAKVGSATEGSLVVGDEAFSVYTNNGSKYASVQMGAGTANNFRMVNDSGTFSMKGTNSSGQNQTYATMSNGSLGVPAAATFTNTVAVQGIATFGAAVTMQRGATFGAPLTVQGDIGIGSNCINFGTGGSMCFAKAGSDMVDVSSNVTVRKSLSVGSNDGIWPVTFGKSGLLANNVYASGGVLAAGSNGAMNASLDSAGNVRGLRVVTAQGVSVTGSNNPLIEYAGATATDRYGMGVNNMATRLYAGNVNNATVKLGFANANGSFSDTVSVTSNAMNVAGSVTASGNSLKLGAAGSNFGMSYDAATTTARAFTNMGSAGSKLALSRLNTDNSFTDFLSVDSNGMVTVRGNLKVCDANNVCKLVALQ